MGKGRAGIAIRASNVPPHASSMGRSGNSTQRLASTQDRHRGGHPSTLRRRVSVLALGVVAVLLTACASPGDTSMRASDAGDGHRTMLVSRGPSVIPRGEDIIMPGFDHVSMETHITNPTTITRKITFTASAERYAENEDALERFMASHVPWSATVETPLQGVWQLTFTGDAPAIAAATKTALGGTDVTFKFTMGQGPGDPSEKVLTLQESASCDAVCATQEAIIDTVDTVEGYKPASTLIDTSASQAVTFINAPPVSSVSTSFRFSADGSASATTTFTLPPSSLNVIDNGFAQRLNPGKDVGTLSTAHHGSDTTYTVTISAKTMENFKTAYKRWAPASSITATDDSAGPFLLERKYVIDPGLRSLLGRHPVTGATNTEIVLPFGRWVSEAPESAKQSPSINGAVVSLAGIGPVSAVGATAPSVGGLIACGILLGILVAGALHLARRGGVAWSRNFGVSSPPLTLCWAAPPRHTADPRSVQSFPTHVSPLPNRKRRPTHPEDNEDP